MPNPAQNHPQLDPRRLSSAALQAFFNLSSHWDLSVAEERTLLGAPPESTFYKWKAEKTAGRLSHDTLERISYLLGIFKDLNILLPSSRAAAEWVRKPNTAPLFNGQSALKRMLAGSLVDLADVRRYLDAQRGT
ncbi:MAG: MbcA/ParS/Xre antitoxin family protein [Porticoccus sp.]|nr:MbcA/ParS/Xre antitoxin family protein [Porticoccus sp.]